MFTERDEAGPVKGDAVAVDMSDREAAREAASRAERPAAGGEPDAPDSGSDADADLFWPIDANDPAAGLLRANNERELKLYTINAECLLRDKRCLQRAGLVVYWKDHVKGLLAVGSQVLTIPQFKEAALRERRVTRRAVHDSRNRQ